MSVSNFKLRSLKDKINEELLQKNEEIDKKEKVISPKVGKKKIKE